MYNNSNTPAVGVAVMAVFIALNVASKHIGFVFISMRYSRIRVLPNDFTKK